MGAAATPGDVARLFGRVAFGATAADLDRWTGRPYAEVVEALLEVPTATLRAAQPDEPRRLALVTTGADVGVAQSWWLERMRTARYPLEERMTLLWHDHFATAVAPQLPDLAMVLQQNQTLREHALGNVRNLVAAMTVDPAMLHWLDGQNSAPPLPNENYAREFFELFTLGRSPQVFTETDIREAARAFTGWGADQLTRRSAFRPQLHDRGAKRILGTTVADLGAAEHVAVARLALDQPVAARFLAATLVAHLAYETEGDLLTRPDPLVRAVADALRRHDWELVPALRVLLLSPEFRTSSARSHQRAVRSPAEVLVAACKGLGIAADNRSLLELMTRMGQQLFVPPNVGGWPTGSSWLSPATVIARYDLGLRAVALARGLPVGAPALPALPASTDLAGWARRMGLAGLSPNTEAALRRYLAAEDAGTEADRQAGVAALLLASPDWTVM